MSSPIPINTQQTLLAAKEYVNQTTGPLSSASVVTGSAVALTTATAANVTTLSLAPGDYELSAEITLNLTGATLSRVQLGFGTTTATLPAASTTGLLNSPIITTTSAVPITLNPQGRISVATTTTIYLVAHVTFSAGTVAAWGVVRARKVA